MTTTATLPELVAAIERYRAGEARSDHELALVVERHAETIVGALRADPYPPGVGDPRD